MYANLQTTSSFIKEERLGDGAVQKNDLVFTVLPKESVTRCIDLKPQLEMWPKLRIPKAESVSSLTSHSRQNVSEKTGSRIGFRKRGSSEP